MAMSHSVLLTGSMGVQQDVSYMINLLLCGNCVPWCQLKKSEYLAMSAGDDGVGGSQGAAAPEGEEAAARAGRSRPARGQTLLQRPRGAPLLMAFISFLISFCILPLRNVDCFGLRILACA